jgi:2-keto-4-pentenoate hydratase/2-oxohepta-3-ene-1,7-dioic acid hydratase in catechol pathway
VTYTARRFTGDASRIVRARSATDAVRARDRHSEVRLIRLGPAGAERAHLLLEDERVLDVADWVGDFDSAFFARGGLHELRELAQTRRDTAVAMPSVRLGSPVARPGKIVGIGLNYADHAAESGEAIPKEPAVFFKATNTMVGPEDDVRIPRGSRKTDWEVELGVVIGRPCRYLESEEEALAAVAGYMVSHDVSEREFQLERGGQWVKGKSCETFNPAGPWLVTADQIPDPGALDLWLDVNGHRRQIGTTRNMIFGVAKIISYLSQFMVLDPGDVINTGTPGGVALGMPDHPYLRAGDIVELGITGLGRQRQRFVSAP